MSLLLLWNGTNQILVLICVSVSERSGCRAAVGLSPRRHRGTSQPANSGYLVTEQPARGRALVYIFPERAAEAYLGPIMCFGENSKWINSILLCASVCVYKAIKMRVWALGIYVMSSGALITKWGEDESLYSLRMPGSFSSSDCLMVGIFCVQFSFSICLIFNPTFIRSFVHACIHSVYLASVCSV